MLRLDILEVNFSNWTGKYGYEKMSPQKHYAAVKMSAYISS